MHYSIFLYVSEGLLPSNGSFPKTNPYIIQPTAQTSYPGCINLYEFDNTSGAK